jgi:L-lysine exporter family protein LysE/ArgO
VLWEGAIAVAAQGFVLGAGLCCTLGPQSVYVLRQGVRRQDAIAVATVCVFIDMAMVALGVVGFGAVLVTLPNLELVAIWGAAALALAFGTRSLQNALWPSVQVMRGDPGRRWGVVAMALALSLLNPQVYLEMMAFVGSVALSYPAALRFPFMIGVMLVSPLWFFGLAYGGRRLALRLGSRNALRVFDAMTAVIMIGLAALLLVGQDLA